MTKLYCAGCVFAIASLVGCHSDSTGNPPDEPAATPAARSITLTTSSGGLVQRKTAKGIAVHLDGRFQNAVLARRNRDGSLAIECHDDAQQAETFLQSAPATATKPEVQ